jgi:CRISPR-associated endonuclease Csy4
MESYLDIKMVADDDIPIYFIRNKVYTKLHKVLHTLKSTNIGVSFPNYRLKLGDVIRLHAAESCLTELQATNWLGGLSGYCEMTDILSVPEKVEGYRTISRIQQNKTNAKLNRLSKRNAMPDDDIKSYKAKMFAESLDNPYLELQSKSTGEKYRLYIAFGELLEQEVPGEFNHFGLSKTATIPWF